MELHHSSEQEAPKKVTKLFLNMPLVKEVLRMNDGDLLRELRIHRSACALMNSREHHEASEVICAHLIHRLEFDDVLGEERSR